MRLWDLGVQAEELGWVKDTKTQRSGGGMESSLEAWQLCLALYILCLSDGVLRDTEVEVAECYHRIALGLV